MYDYHDGKKEKKHSHGNKYGVKSDLQVSSAKSIYTKLNVLGTDACRTEGRGIARQTSLIFLFICHIEGALYILFKLGFRNQYYMYAICLSLMPVLMGSQNV